MNDKPIKSLGVFENMQESMDSFNPYNQLNDKEFDIVLNRIGTYLYLIHNKNINPTNLFLHVMGNQQIQGLFVAMTSCPSVILILRSILNRYPNLIKSKMLRSKAIKINKQFKKKNVNVR